MSTQQLNEDIVKSELHSVAYDIDTQELVQCPTSRILVDDSWELAIALHKWDKYIALYSMGDYERPSKQRLEEYESSITPAVVREIDRGTVPDNVYVYKYSVNVWRRVEYKRTKWVFAEPKPSKEDPSHVQRVIVDET